MLLLTCLCLYASLTVLNRHYMRSQLASRYSLLWFKNNKIHLAKKSTYSLHKCTKLLVKKSLTH